MAAIKVHFMRHGEVASHRGDVQVTCEGLRAARNAGRNLAQQMGSREVVHFLYAPTRRTEETAQTVREGMVEVIHQQTDSGVRLLSPEENWAIRNPDVYVGGKRVEMVSSAEALLEQLTGTGLTISDLDHVPFFPQFWNADDRIGHWLSQVELPGENGNMVAQRFLHFARSLADLPRERLHRFVCVTHSGCMRAFLLKYLLKEDPGEPEYCESVDLTFSNDSQVEITYRGFSQTLYPTYHFLK